MSDIPYDEEAEECLLGAMLLSSQAIEAVAEAVVAADFHKPSHGSIYDAIIRVRDSGSVVNTLTVAEELKRHGSLEVIGGGHVLMYLQNNTPGTSGARRYAEIVLDRALRRRLMGEARELADQAADLSLDVEDVFDNHQALMATMRSSIIDAEPDDIAVEDFLRQPRNEISPWVVHGIIRRRHKLLLVGFEGHGKSWMLRFIAMCAAYGVHPFRHNSMPQRRTLIVDAENPEDALFDSFEAILRQVTHVSPKDETVNRLWWRPAGINLRNRVDLAQLENVIRTRRPDLVCLGPLYATYENTSKDFGWESAAREVQTILKRLMVRYDFALMIEDHAPQGEGGSKRAIRPYGSSFWRRWPDIGIGLEPIDDREDMFELKRWRGDRVPTDWPKRITRGSVMNSPWPFVGEWDLDSNVKHQLGEMTQGEF